MINNSYDAISVILQGALSVKTKRIIESWRHCAPGCEIILSTWVRDQELTRYVDKYLVSPDPGVFPVLCNGRVVRNENTNRQIVSTREGINAASRRFSIKWRTDFEFNPQLMQNFLKIYMSLVGDCEKKRLVVFSINSTNPFSGIQLVGQLSDWFYFGETNLLADLLPTIPIPLIGENIEIPPDIQDVEVFPIARFSAEQWMLREGLARVHKINLNRYDDKEAIYPFLNLIGTSILIINPRRVGLVTEKYDYMFNPKWNFLRAFLGFRMSTISEIDSFILGVTFLKPVAIGILKLKALIFNSYKITLKYFRQ